MLIYSLLIIASLALGIAAGVTVTRTRGTSADAASQRVDSATRFASELGSTAVAPNGATATELTADDGFVEWRQIQQVSGQDYPDSLRKLVQARGPVLLNPSPSGRISELIPNWERPGVAEEVAQFYGRLPATQHDSHSVTAAHDGYDNVIGVDVATGGTVLHQTPPASTVSGPQPTHRARLGEDSRGDTPVSQSHGALPDWDEYWDGHELLDRARDAFTKQLFINGLYGVPGAAETFIDGAKLDAGWCNGNTPGSFPGTGGSTPSPAMPSGVGPGAVYTGDSDHEFDVPRGGVSPLANPTNLIPFPNERTEL